MIRKLARPMIASVYIADGVDTLVNTETHVEGTGAAIDRLRSVLPSDYARKVPRDAEMVTRGIGAAKVGAGSMLAIGKFPRLSAGVLAAVSVPTIVARHAFWETQDEDERAARRSGFLTNLALLGGLFITTADTAGKPGLAWRTKHAAKVTNKKVQAALPTKSETEKFAEAAQGKAQSFTDSAMDFFGDAADKATEYWDEATDKATSYIGAAHDYIDDNKDDWLKAAQNNAKTAKKRVVKAAAKAQDRADEAAKTASKKSAKYQKQAEKATKKAKKKLAKKYDF